MNLGNQISKYSWRIRDLENPQTGTQFANSVLMYKIYFHNSLIPRGAYFLLPLESKLEATSGWNFTKCISEVKVNQLKVKNMHVKMGISTFKQNSLFKAGFMPKSLAVFQHWRVSCWHFYSHSSCVMSVKCSWSGFFFNSATLGVAFCYRSISWMLMTSKTEMYKWESGEKQLALSVWFLYNISFTTTWIEKPLIRECCNHKGSCTLFIPYLSTAAGISSSIFVRISVRQLTVSSLSKGIASTLNFHESIGSDGTQTRNLSHQNRVLNWLS